MNEQPIPMILYCPTCGLQHWDRPNHWTDKFDAPMGTEHPDDIKALNDAIAAYEAEWTNPPHRSHKCLRCGTIWRPSDVYTTGVLELDTVGKHDTFIPSDDWLEILRQECMPFKK